MVLDIECSIYIEERSMFIMSVSIPNAHERMWTTMKDEMDKRCQYGPDFGRSLAGYVLQMMGQIEKQCDKIV